VQPVADGRVGPRVAVRLDLGRRRHAVELEPVHLKLPVGDAQPGRGQQSYPDAASYMLYGEPLMKYTGGFR
jgi:hypothetical protein